MGGNSTHVGLCTHTASNTHPPPALCTHAVLKQTKAPTLMAAWLLPSLLIRWLPDCWPDPTPTLHSPNPIHHPSQHSEPRAEETETALLAPESAATVVASELARPAVLL